MLMDTTITNWIDSSGVGDWDFERSYNADYGVEDGSKIPFIHNREELKLLINNLYIVNDYMDSYERYDAFFESINNIIKGCFTIHACREYPIHFKFYRTDTKTHTAQLRHFLLNLIAWRPFVELYGFNILNETFMMDPEKDISNLEEFINTRIILPLREHYVKSSVINSSVAEVIHQYRNISLDFSQVMNLSFGYDTFLEMYDKHPRIREIMDATYDDLEQPYDIESRLSDYQDEVIDIIKNDKTLGFNPIGVVLRSETGIKHKQLSEFMIAEGLKPTLDGKTIPIVIKNSTLIGGLDRPSYEYIDTMGARKSLVSNKTVMGKAGYFGKTLVLLVRTLRMSQTVADCGSTHLMPYIVRTKKHLRKLDGKYYKLHPDDDDYKVLVASKDKDLIGQTVYVRSIVTCCLDDEVCSRCIGLTTNINRDIADGYAAFLAEEITKVINQNVLSTKHLLTTNSEMLRFTPEFNDFFNLTQSEIYPNVNNNEKYGDEINNYGIYIDPADIEKVSELDDDSLYNTVITTGRFYIRDLTGQHKDIEIYATDEEGKHEEREIYIAREVADLLRKNKNVIPFFELDDDSKLFEVTFSNNELTKPLYDLMALVNKKAKTGERTIEEMSQNLLDLLVDAGINAPVTASEMIVNRLVRSTDNEYERPDFSKKEMPSYRIVTTDHALERNPSPFIGLSYQAIKRQILSDDLYTVRNRSSYLDPLFNTVVSMKNLKQYAMELDPKVQEQQKKEREERMAQTFYNANYRRDFLANYIKNGGMQKAATM